jgi:hypothetical protein
MATFNIVHLSDFHFGEVSDRKKAWRPLSQKNKKIPATHDSTLAELVARWVYFRAEQLESSGDRLDAMILTGDLATTGLKEDLNVALNYIDSNPTRLWYRSPTADEPPTLPLRHRATLKGLADLCLLVPGNHDRFKNNDCDAGGIEFDTVFDAFWAKNLNGVIATVIPKKKSEEDNASDYLALIGADGCLRSGSDATDPWLHQMCQGYLYNNTFEAMKLKTEEAQRLYPGVVVVWFIHFPPTGIVHSWERLRYYERLEQASKTYNVAFVLSGHTHLKEVYPAKLGSTIWNGGSATQFAEKRGHWIHFLQLEVTQGMLIRATRDNFLWDNNIGNWRKESADVLP